LKYAEGTGSVKNTPKALANFSPGFEQARTLGMNPKCEETLKGFVLKANPFRVGAVFYGFPSVVAALQRWAGISQRLRRTFNGTSTFGVLSTEPTPSAYFQRNQYLPRIFQLNPVHQEMKNVDLNP